MVKMSKFQTDRGRGERCLTFNGPIYCLSRATRSCKLRVRLAWRVFKVGALATTTEKETTWYRFGKNKNCGFEDTDCYLAVTTAAIMTLDL